MADQSYAVPCPPFQLQLSHWDKRFIPIYSKRLLCFPLLNQTINSNENIVQLLLDALRATVDQIPFLAGSVVPFSKEQPWLRDIRSEGAAYLETRDLSREMSYLDLRKSNFASSLLDADLLCPFPAATCVKDGPVDVCRIRANFVDGGLILAIQIIHTVFDGRGILEVLKLFAGNFRKGQTGELLREKEAAGTPYTFDRTSVLSGKGLDGDIANHPCWTASPLSFHSGFAKTKNVCMNFSISAESLRNLKESMASSSNLPISTHDAISALIWKSLIISRYRAGIINSRLHLNVHFSVSVDCRSRLNLPDPYYGNAIYGIKSSVPLSSLLANQDDHFPALKEAAQAIRTEIASVTGAKFLDLVAFVERTESKMLTRLSIIEDLALGTVMLISYFGFDMHGLDFGPALGDGKIEAFRLPAQGLVPGVPVLFPRLPDGGAEFVVCESEEVMKELGEDEDFGRFVERQGAQ
jgi:methylglutaconyl-CoA hydratase